MNFNISVTTEIHQLYDRMIQSLFIYNWLHHNFIFWNVLFTNEVNMSQWEMVIPRANIVLILMSIDEILVTPHPSRKR